MDRIEFTEKLKKQFDTKLDIILTEEQVDKFYIFIDFLLSENEKYNLTNITQIDDIIEKHLIDSCYLIKILSNDEKNSNKKIIDVGTGAGFPAVPLAIILDNWDFTLADSLNKRIKFLLQVKEKLGLKNIYPIHTRAEDLAKQNDHREQYDYVVSRAVANINTLLTWTIPFIKVSAVAYLYKTENALYEIESSKQIMKEVGDCKYEIIKYDEKLFDLKHIIVKIIKNKKTDIKNKTVSTKNKRRNSKS